MDRPPAAKPGDASEDLAGGAILCAVCDSEITHQRHAMAVNGRHEHAFFNPAGIAFEIRCFHAAHGTTFRGAASAEFTWFAGYRWRVVLCATCHTHLGWLFTGDGLFYGLIADRLY
ncbi:cereblon family protein [Desulfobulbus sp.]|uniref:cereblon family protein n=1 Tax=Desulfobulbus sp. TaxID=895 RepID=UPI00286F9C8E|nr:cereblon family protein [Desulfobulbus sp.]